MTIEVDPDWWKTLFDDVYLLTDARSVDDDAVTRQEIDIFTALIPMHHHHRVLDLCGGHGRHALELARRGYNDCTVLDYSQTLLDIGAREACSRKRTVKFVQGDARCTGLPSKAYDLVLVLGNSLGYILEPDADLLILQESLRLVRPGGWLLLDVTDGAAVRRSIAPQAWHEIGDDVVVCRQREIRGGCICARELVLNKTRGVIRDRTYAIRLYAEDDLYRLVERAGFRDIQVHTGGASFKHQDVGCMNHRLVVVARKP